MLLVNASNLYVGGGLQVGISIIEEFVKLDLEFIAAVSPPVYNQLGEKGRKKSIIIDKTPSGLLNFTTRRKLDGIIKKYDIQDVFTVFGPSYWNPGVKNHLVGFALPWLIYDTQAVYRKLPAKEKLKKILLHYLQPYYYKKNATKIVVETADVKYKAAKLLGFRPEKVYLVSNTISANFSQPSLYDNSAVSKLPPKKTDEIWLLTVAYNYPHKNLQVLYPLLEALPDNYKFVLTLDAAFLASVPEEHQKRIILTGNVTNAQCPPLYQYCDGMLLPTLLECFSASYVEAAYMNKPVFTSDRDFAKTVCGENAFYFDPLNSDDIAFVIKNAFASPDKIERYCIEARKAVDKLPNATERAKLYLSAIYAE
ncbi:glycosyltransferase [Mixta hanseatica]|uniref:Glycosyltransferase n=1 Tax=Mixta hanseatica TaxID=2872648 RepID=A0ABY4R617_9GAMM|nr:glycosyltransferase [Mixta hanseatica]UQY42857.1 glycosyltransferase [Mixta hanseatica]